MRAASVAPAVVVTARALPRGPQMWLGACGWTDDPAAARAFADEALAQIAMLQALAEPGAPALEDPDLTPALAG